MPRYTAPVRDTEFLLNSVFDIGQYSDIDGFKDATPDIIKAILEESGKFSEEVVQPLNLSGDKEGCTLKNGEVSTPKGFKEAYSSFSENGWVGLCCHPEYGGQGLPQALGLSASEYVTSANMSFGMYPGLSQGAYKALAKYGDDAQKKKYLPKLASGEWTGTMNLTEPHCGTDLGLLRTKAEKADDGSYKITGTKIFISAGEHDLTDNIIHLVLARIEGAPEGTKGVSLFVVPKFLIGDDGSLGERNSVLCGSLEEKMGIHANSTCVMNYDGATGWLVGEENRGLRNMFVMMNEARLGVGIQGLAVSEVAYQNAVDYAKDRLQGRALTGPKAPDKEADPIIVHPDIRRNLAVMRSVNEAGRALVLWTAIKADLAEKSPDEKIREQADDHMGLLTPVIKGVLTDLGFDNTVMAQQVYGGHGFIQEWGMEQFVRDARITMIYEGANGIQGLDLVGRKLPRNGGRAMMAFFAEVDAFIKSHGETEDMKDLCEKLKAGRDDLEKATMWFMANAMANPDNAGAGAWDYMHLFGRVVLGFMWGLMIEAAHKGLSSGEGDKDFFEAKVKTGTFFMDYMMPQTTTYLARITAGADNLMSMPEDSF